MTYFGLAVGTEDRREGQRLSGETPTALAGCVDAVRASVLSIGAELLRGDIVDTNAPFLAQELAKLGFDVRRMAQAGDDLGDLTDEFRTRSRLPTSCSAPAGWDRLRTI